MRAVFRRALMKSKQIYRITGLALESKTLELLKEPKLTHQNLLVTDCNEYRIVELIQFHLGESRSGLGCVAPRTHGVAHKVDRSRTAA